VSILANEITTEKNMSTLNNGGYNIR